MMIYALLYVYFGKFQQAFQEKIAICDLEIVDKYS